MSDDDLTRFRFSTDAYPGTALTVERALVVEALSEPYEASVVLQIHDPDADVAELIGRDAVLTISRAGIERRVCGVICEVSERGSDNELTKAALVLAPALSLSTLRRSTRMFQEKKVSEILETVLKDALDPYGREAQLSLEGTYEPREYCLQYQESDLDFVHRLMEEEGIAYDFDHGGEREVMRLSDSNRAFELAQTVGGDGQVRFEPHNLLGRGTEPVQRFDVELRDTTTSVTVADADWTLSGHVVSESAEGEDAQGRVRESYEHGIGASVSIGSYDAGVRRYQKNDATQQASVRKEAAVRDALVAFAVGRVVGLTPGRRISLLQHPAVGVDGDYLVTRVEHRSEPAEGTLLPAAAALPGATKRRGPEPYHTRFWCIPLGTPHRPLRRAKKPRIFGIESAVVTGPSGEEVHVDEHGRIKVRFHWDRENEADETSSCWIRVKQEWAGAGWGFWWVPRIGMEVVVHFVDGDPDRPLVTGAVYDGANPTPYALPDEKTKSTIKSSSSLGGDGDNELRFEDKAGSEEIYSHAQKDYDEVVENDHQTTVHHDQTNTVDNDQTQTIDANQTERVDANQQMTVGGDRTVHVGGNFDETVSGTETRTVTGDVSESFAANETRTIGVGVTESIGGNETRKVGASQQEMIAAGHVLTVGGSSDVSIAGALTRTAVGGVLSLTPASHTVDALGGWTVVAPAGITMIGPGGIKLTMPGGVTRVDSFWDLLAGIHTRAGNIQMEVFAAKLSITGISSGIWVTKVDLHGSEKAANVAELIVQSLAARQEAALNKEEEGLHASFAASSANL